MAVHSFYISVELPEDEKARILSDVNVTKYRKSDDLIYKGTIYIDDINLEECCWWHINAGLYDFFHSCEVLYDFCQAIEKIKPNFNFYFLGKIYQFSFRSLIDFVSFLYPKVYKYKKFFENNYGILSVHPQEFFSFRRKNKRLFK